MSCKVEFKALDKLEEKGVIDSKNRILNINSFEKINQDLTDLAKNKYNVDMGDNNMLFSLSATNKGFVAKPNSDYFNKLQVAKDNYQEDSDSYKSQLDKINSLLSDKAEPIFNETNRPRSERVFEEAKNLDIPDITNISNKAKQKVNKSIDNLNNAIKRTHAAARRKTDTKSQYKFIDELEELVREMEKYAEDEYWHSITLYVDKLRSIVLQLHGSFQKRINDKNDVLATIKRYKDYLTTFDMINDFEELISNAKFSKETNIPKDEIEKIQNLLRTFNTEHNSLKQDFKSFQEAQLAKILNNDKYITRVETKWRNSLERKYNAIKPQGISKSEWIAEKMNTTYKEEIRQDIKDAARDAVSGIEYDMGKLSLWLSDNLNVTGKLIEVVQNIIAQTRNKINERTIKYDFNLDAIQKKLIAEKGDLKPEKLYKNVIKKSKKGRFYITDGYSIDFLNALDELSDIESEIENTIIELRKNLSEDEIKEDDRYKQVAKKKEEWVNSHLTKHGKGDNIKYTPKSKYAIKENLSEAEALVARQFKAIVQQGRRTYHSKNTLLESRFMANFYRLPSYTKTDLERFQSGDVSGMFTDKFKDFSIRPDDIGFASDTVDGQNNPINHLAIHFRGTIDSKDQSLDLLSLIRAEASNVINYGEKSKVEMQLNAIHDIANQKEYAAVSDKTGELLNTLFRKKAPFPTKRGESNQGKKIKGMIEGFLYDTLHYNAGSVNNVDMNKVVRYINGGAAMIGMSANVASGIANISNGFSQLLFEAFGGNRLNFSSLKKAEAKYTRDLPNIFKDLGNPVKKSFTNQVIQMFDVFGGYSVTQQKFIKNSIAKALAETKTLSGLQEGGEHMLQGVLTMSILDNLKVMNSNSKFIDKDGNETSEKNAASLLDMLKFNDKGILTMDEKVKFTNHNLLTEYHKGGKAHIDILVKKKIHDIFGAYDSNMQNELYKHWYGKMLMMFKRFLIPGLQHRWRGLSSSIKRPEDLTEKDLFYSSALKEYEEGIYTTLIRVVYPALRYLKVQHIPENYKALTNYEKANLKKAVAELGTMFAILPLMSILLAGSADDKEDDPMYWFAMYQLRRLQSELQQYISIDETWRIMENPIAGTRFIQNVFDVIGHLFEPWNLAEENIRGENKFYKDLKQIVPVLIQFDKSYKKSYQFFELQGN